MYIELCHNESRWYIGLLDCCICYLWYELCKYSHSFLNLHSEDNIKPHNIREAIKHQMDTIQIVQEQR